MALSVFIRHQQSGLTSSRAELNAYTRALMRCVITNEEKNKSANREIGVPRRSANREMWRSQEISIVYTSLAAIRKLNEEWRGIDKATDVLSFPAPKVMRRGGHLGDLAICLPVCAEEVPEFGESLAEVVALMLVHGYLHLTGMDHDTAKSERLMEKQTAGLLSKCAQIPRPKIRVRKTAR
ncbi:hypothetical protein BH09SUM1_BH09SUM1_29650 [soil metagenome]